PVRRRRPGQAAGNGDPEGTAAAPVAGRKDPPRFGDDLPEVPGEGPGPAVRDGEGPGRRPAAVRQPVRDPGEAHRPAREIAQMGGAEPGLKRGGVASPARTGRGGVLRVAV